MSDPALFSRHAEMLQNRLRKNERHLSRWATKQQTNCYRLYDRDIPEIPLVVERYGEHVQVHRYERPWADDDPRRDAGWMQALVPAVANALETPLARVHVKERKRASGGSQYGTLDKKNERFAVSENGLLFLVNLTDKLDSGLFMDHRMTRARVQAESQGKRVLNLFSYTGAFTVYAAAGGAAATTSVDLNAGYLDWTRDNLELNDLWDPTHALVREDARLFLADAARAVSPRFDIVVLDPPTFSNSKKMDGDMDLRRDHVDLVMDAIQVLAPGGVLYFSTNRRGFHLDDEILRAAQVEDISQATIPQDFRDQGIHRCFRITQSR